MPNKPKGLLIVVTGPSAVGKGTICRALLAETPGIRFSVSCTTRPKRPGEVDGVEYYFISKEEFERRIAAGEFLEWAEVYGNYYGTPRGYVEEVTAQGQDVILDIDRVGARAVREQYPDAVSVFVIPPSMEALRQRIAARGTESPEAVARRLAEAPEWIREGLTYDYVIVNDDLARAVAELRAIIMAEKARTVRNGAALIETLLEKGALTDE
ncbi:guanylate kinase [Symbiobacterium thermophilum]|uniref:Guanylate kinase n=2 Tax=Symbiobacterium thermophilum TaxID=2734 RepID=KGUA_SYMTH|nr:guanylate kinase [Symbiobacterium thermophilum]Q67PR9.1 RecName: Full=Guanylate kinase; AltName: Full=GMP kinase [Symbiobacterium thermophilum IAM 14863]MBY6276985.1 guanylate kinase [Symbiobacterium thermophilum]BAD40324.1 guanylate kinase [Symbiobacterium thermophilum IAM 14863]